MKLPMLEVVAVMIAVPGLACAEMPTVRVADDGRTFVLSTGEPFVPWGFNYDHDETGRLIEDYWVDEWAKVEEDFREMRELGANVVRIHLQFGKFMRGPTEPDPASLGRLGKLLELAEQTGLYLDLTGLGCYHKKDVPPWYDAMDEAARWEAQAVFWGAVAKTCAASPAVFFYDLMNEPVSPAGATKDRGDWLGPAFGDKHFVQRISLDQAGRPRPQIALAWVRKLKAAIREHDKRALVTVGLVDWSLNRPGLTSGFEPEVLAPELDLICVHLYPESNKIDEAIETLRLFAAAGKPVIIEETFPLKAGQEQFAQFINRSREHASGWIGFYWGATREDLRKSGTFAGAFMGAWLDYFVKGPPRD